MLWVSEVFCAGRYRRYAIQTSLARATGGRVHWSSYAKRDIQWWLERVSNGMPATCLVDVDTVLAAPMHPALRRSLMALWIRGVLAAFSRMAPRRGRTSPSSSSTPLRQ
jgi:hypothetical protein